MATRARSGPAPAAPAMRGTPTWLVRSSLVVCLLGLAAAAYLTFEHFTSSSTLACSTTGPIDCLKVTTSSYSKVAGVPVALIGLLFFVAMTALCSPPAWRSARSWVPRLRLAGVCAGMVSVLYLVWVELYQVEAICEWCTAVHVLTFVLFVLVVLDSTGALAAD